MLLTEEQECNVHVHNSYHVKNGDLIVKEPYVAVWRKNVYFDKLSKKDMPAVFKRNFCSMITSIESGQNYKYQSKYLKKKSD